MNRSQQTKTQIDGISRVGQIDQIDAASPVPVASATKIRRGFTLVELLVVIAIIGILISMLAVAIGPVLRRVHEGAVTAETGQLELAVESFKNQYGFYPPAFGGPRGIGGGDLNGLDASGSLERGASGPADLLPFLNKISANHGELGAMPGSNPSVSRLTFWWNHIGKHLDSRSSLVFWLSSLSANKQFPLTGGLPLNGAGNPQLPSAYGGGQVLAVAGGTSGTSIRTAGAVSPGVESDPGIDVPRDSYYTFRNEQLASRALDTNTINTASFTQAAFINANSFNLSPGIRVYNTPYGDEADNRGNAYFYRDSGTYNTAGGSYLAVINGVNVPVNPNTFQIFTYGNDGMAADATLDQTALARGLLNEDNITNFANGRLDAFDWQANLGASNN